MILSISGVPGSGKTSVAKLLAKRLGMNMYSIGDLRGKMAKERGVTIDELNAIGENDATTDTSVDDYQKELGNKEDNFVIEGRLSWHFIPHSFKIFLTCDESQAAQRIYEAKKSSKSERSDEPLYSSEQDALDAIKKRITSDKLRYKKYYDLDYQDPKNYDLVVDAGKTKSAEETADIILNHLRSSHFRRGS
jgi:cytidylate kinase